VHFYHRGHDGERIDLAYHSNRDLPARVERASVDELARLLHALTAEPIPPHDGDAVWLPLASNTVIPRWLLVIGCGLLAVASCALLVRTRRRRGGGKLKLLVALAVFVGAVALVTLLERAIAGDHPAPWVHAPLRWLIGELLLIAGVIGLATRGLARLAPWGGERRYLAVAAIAPLVLGCAWLASGAAELAWVWLVPAFFAALAPRLPWPAVRLLAILPLLLPLALVLGPDQIREAAWNGFMPVALPFATWIAVLSFPIFAGLAWYLRARDRSGPLGTFILPVGCLLAMISGTVLVVSTSPPCSAAQFHSFHLACEVVSGVR